MAWMNKESILQKERLRQRIRDELLAVGITPIDRPDEQTRWQRSN
jgi:hypothetical protein